jgi:hypothetical protein
LPEQDVCGLPGQEPCPYRVCPCDAHAGCSLGGILGDRDAGTFEPEVSQLIGGVPVGDAARTRPERESISHARADADPVHQFTPAHGFRREVVRVWIRQRARVGSGWLAAAACRFELTC